MIYDDYEFVYEDDIKIKENCEHVMDKSEICCTNKCMLLFDDDFKTCLKDKLSLLNRMEKQIYLFAMISINEEKKNSSLRMKSSKYFEYTVKEYGVSRSVCKTAFIELHDTTPAFVRTICIKMSKKHLLPLDERGKHRKGENVKLKDSIEKHLLEILESPYIFKCCKKNMGQPNVYRLWLDYKSKHGKIHLATYNRYVQKLITPDVAAKFMSAKLAKDISDKVKHLNDKKKRTDK